MVPMSGAQLQRLGALGQALRACKLQTAEGRGPASRRVGRAQLFAKMSTGTGFAATASTNAASRRAVSLGSTRSKWYRGVPPVVPPEQRHSVQDCMRAYEGRFMMTTLQEQHKLVGDHVEQVRQTHQEKQAYFQQHAMPTMSWNELQPLTHERSMQQRQPAYFGDVGGPSRIGVMPKRVSTPLGGRSQQAAHAICAKSGRFFGT